MLVYTGSHRGCIFRITKRVNSLPEHDPKNVYLDSFVRLPDNDPFVAFANNGYDLRHLYAPKMRKLCHIGPLPSLTGFWIGCRAMPHESTYTHGLTWAKSVCYHLIGIFLEEEYGILKKKSNGSTLHFVKPMKERSHVLSVNLEENLDEE